MPRKRDFMLFTLVVLFLVIGIVSTTTWQSWSERLNRSYVSISTTDPVERTASLTDIPDEAVLRQERLERIRATLVAEQGSSVQMPKTLLSEEPVVPPSEPETSSVLPTCPAPSVTHVTWDSRELTVQESEGALVVYRATTYVNSVSTTAASDLTSRTVVLQLPLRSFPDQPRCIEVDVVGIAMDGSLIRNTETSLYGIFGSDTQVGYTLDGFPLYGSPSTMMVDDCGGAMVAGSYRYFVGSESVLGCYMSEPVILP